MFPILGGRLLKPGKGLGKKDCQVVSNPWREAIEDLLKVKDTCKDLVSNPWREAIEESARLSLLTS